MKKNPLDGDNKSYFLNLVMQLRKVCNHPYLFDGVEEDEAGDLGDHLI
jgi:SNF2 family DNA or RNA helicase